jgi:hypothetical protein
MTGIFLFIVGSLAAAAEDTSQEARAIAEIKKLGCTVRHTQTPDEAPCLHLNPRCH